MANKVGPEAEAVATTVAEAREAAGRAVAEASAAEKMEEEVSKVVATAVELYSPYRIFM